ncbi:nucleotide pyrophosphohydrolase [Candidatus Woesearchaeota archaeon]|nr:nucleotide pyrophosphohydrolase [Candidatus Woesearchaeota archaeon]
MSLKDVQKEVDNWINQYKLGYFKPLEILARLTEETGELAREINHLYGPKKKKPSEDVKDLADEMGDIIFTLACLANSHNIDLEQAFQRVMAKYNDRDKDRYEKK